MLSFRRREAPVHKSIFPIGLISNMLPEPRRPFSEIHRNFRAGLSQIRGPFTRLPGAAVWKLSRARRAAPAGHMPAISFSTRSSTERNGSLHRTVRWAWSFSFRCTQQTKKSRRFSWARRINSPRSFARVKRRDFTVDWVHLKLNDQEK